MKASELLERYKTYLVDVNRKVEHYVAAATAFLRKQETGTVLIPLEDTILSSSESRAHQLSYFLTFLQEYGLLQTIIENDFENVFAKDYDIIEQYCELHPHKVSNKSDINIFLKSIEKKEAEPYIVSLPNTHRLWVLNFLEWIQSSRMTLSVLSVQEITKWISELSRYRKGKMDGKITLSSVLKKAEAISLTPFESLLLQAVLVSSLSIIDFASFKVKELEEWAVRKNNKALTKLLSEGYPQKNRLVFPNGKVEAEKLVKRVIKKLDFDGIQTLTEWRKRVVDAGI